MITGRRSASNWVIVVPRAKEISWLAGGDRQGSQRREGPIFRGLLDLTGLFSEALSLLLDKAFSPLDHFSRSRNGERSKRL